ncbi:MAG: hypothetical protein AUI11_11730 [Acidobacteria bacterium 13_2_20CM_2_66_4]|nr:MAG: hypothetical protein AUI11_11730 [Acidobacteria bacterium 13_2_20CM_2_66_4]
MVTAARELQPRSLDLEHQRAEMRRNTEDLKVPLAQAASWIEDRLELPVKPRLDAGHFEGDRLRATARRAVGASEPPAAGFAQLDCAHRYHPSQHLLERPSNERDIVAAIDGSRQRAQKIAEGLTSIASAWTVCRGHRVAPYWCGAARTKSDAMSRDRQLLGKRARSAASARHLR